ncbi:hypothetical protein [Pseudobdellovibrio exovorus]|uniref:Uncharacterized protein n=1 Tax=Pseudobdellovibrio exovorus JSS TaxID=1184267 RepID=M4VAE8_9BACT|nr:hypothetical protein [Pseudobdellovibrio exovorus]AGH95445.1 hypothetical protein A11Q_1229 [Pseudobdellovibrio exovorus JSS]
MKAEKTTLSCKIHRSLLRPLGLIAIAVAIPFTGYAANPSLVSAQVMDMQGKPLKQISANQEFKVEYTVKGLAQDKIESLYSDYKVLTSASGDKAFSSLDEACQKSQPITASVKMYPQSDLRSNYNQVVSEKVEIIQVSKELIKLTMKFNPLSTTNCRMSAELKNKIVIPGMTAWMESETGFEDITLQLKKPIELALVDGSSKTE